MLQNIERFKIFWRPYRPAIRQGDKVLKTRQTYYERNCLLGTCYNVVRLGINCPDLVVENFTGLEPFINGFLLVHDEMDISLGCLLLEHLTLLYILLRNLVFWLRDRDIKGSRECSILLHLTLKLRNRLRRLSNLGWAGCSSEKMQLWDLTVAALVRHVFLAPLYFGGIMLIRMQWSTQLEVTNANEDWPERAGFYSRGPVRDENVVRTRWTVCERGDRVTNWAAFSKAKNWQGFFLKKLASSERLLLILKCDLQLESTRYFRRRVLILDRINYINDY